MKPSLSWIARVAQICRDGEFVDLAQGVLRLELFDAAVRATPFPAAERHYTSPSGSPALQRVFLHYLTEEGIDTRGVGCVVCSGGTGAVACILLAALKKGARVLMPSPFWDYHRDLVVTLGMEPWHVPLTDGFRELPEYVDDRWIGENRIAAILAVSPSNPTGRCLGQTSLDRLRRIHARTDVVLIADEVYRDLRFQDTRRESATLFSLLGTKRVYAVHSVSKSLGATGWRIGFALCSESDADEVARINGLLAACAPTPLQHLAAAQWPRARSLSLEASSIVRRNVDRAVAALTAFGLDVVAPDAAPFMLARAKRGGMNGVDLFERLLNMGLATVPAVDFFPSDEEVPWIRLCLSRPETLVDELLKRLKGASLPDA